MEHGGRKRLLTSLLSPLGTTWSAHHDVERRSRWNLAQCNEEFSPCSPAVRAIDL
jgi:hypothetical protein